MHAGDVKGTATRQTADLLLIHLIGKVGQCKADCGSSFHAGIRHEHCPGEVYTHQYVYIDSITSIEVSLFIGKGEEAQG